MADTPPSDSARSESSAERESDGDPPADAADTDAVRTTDRDTAQSADSEAESADTDPDTTGPPDHVADSEAASDRPADPEATGELDEASERPSGPETETTQGQTDGRTGPADASGVGATTTDGPDDVPADIRSYARFSKMDGAQYDRVNGFLRDRTYITAREWAIARLCADFRTETGVEMTKIGENLPELVPFMTDTYTPQAVNQARASFKGKVETAGATFLYGAMCGFFTADELDDLMYRATEVAKFLLEVEGVDLSVDEEIAAEERISSVMREVRRASDALRHEGVECPDCGAELDPESGRADD